MDEIVVVETLIAVEGKEEALKQALKELVHSSRKGEGCIQYDLFEPWEGSVEFLIIMRFKDPKSLQKHESSPHVAAFMEKCEGSIYSGFTYSQWKPIPRKG